MAINCNIFKIAIKLYRDKYRDNIVSWGDSQVRKIILIQRLNKIIFLAPLVDICACFKQKLTQFGYFFQLTTHCVLNHITCQVNAS